jgi:HAD superfamily hydrolase (TIGR01509 family)
MPVRAAIFDMDGLLLDSEKICLDTFLQACQRIGFEPDLSVYYTVIGCNPQKTKQLLMQGYGADFPFDEIKAIWSKSYVEQAYDIPVPLMKGVRQLLNRLKAANYPIAVATSTSHALALTKLKNAHILAYFDVVIGGDQVAKSKPFPDIYLKAATEINQNPGDCYAFEDSTNGVRAALSAGMHVIQVPDLIMPNEEVRGWGHQIVESLDKAVISL